MNRKLSNNDLLQRIWILEKEAEKAKQIQEKLQESEARFKDIANNALEWIWEIDSEGRYTYASPVVKQILEYEPEEVLGKYFFDFFDPNEKASLKQKALKTFESKKRYRKFINRNVRKDGKTVVLSTSGVPIIDKKGMLIGYRGADTDITEQHEAVAALRINEEHLRSLMESASGFAIYRLVYDRESPHSLRVVFVSPSINDILGIPEPMKFETWFEHVHPDDVERMSEANKRAFEKGRLDEVCRMFNNNNGQWRWIHAIATGGETEGAWNSYVNGILIDITDKQNAFEKLKKHEKELEQRARELQETNTALTVLLREREQDKNDSHEKISANIKQLIFPFLSEIRKRHSGAAQLALIEILENRLNELTASFSLKLSSPNIGLTPTEIRVAELVRQGQQTKQMAEVLGLSYKTIQTHRENIRKKLGIKNNKINLCSHLLSMK
jgi:PAS domain S-box-containing protein